MVYSVVQQTVSTMVTIGQPPWSAQDMLDKLETFAELYEERPIKNNVDGMLASTMFLAWFVMQALKPKTIIESGVWRGQGTWFFENACPDAELHCIDLNLARLEYRSERATYYDRDFSSLDWVHLDKDQTVVFFDDHQNAYERVKTSKWFGFKHLVFEDNYPPTRGDCYSLKQAFMNSGFVFTPAKPRSPKEFLIVSLTSILRKHAGKIPANDVDAKYLTANLKTYCELPPVFKTERTRWGDTWDQKTYPTVEPLLLSQDHEYQKVFLEDVYDYNWMCYVELK